MNQAAARDTQSLVAIKVKGEGEQRGKEKPGCGGIELNTADMAEGWHARRSALNAGL
jgi:hypothetical protein